MTTPLLAGPTVMIVTPPGAPIVIGSVGGEKSPVPRLFVAATSKV